MIEYEIGQSVVATDDLLSYETMNFEPFTVPKGTVGVVNKVMDRPDIGFYGIGVKFESFDSPVAFIRKDDFDSFDKIQLV